MRNLIFILFFVLTCTSSLFATEKDSIPYKMFKEDVILSTDVGFYSAPFSLKDQYPLGVGKLKFRNNPKLAVGLGFSYKWFALRLGVALPVNLKPKKDFNETQYFDIGIRFNLKQTYTAIEFRDYIGYVIKDANTWNDSILSSGYKNQFRNKTTSISVSANVWWFINKEFNYQAALGKVGHYTGQGKTWYLRTTLNFFGISNTGGNPIVPTELLDSTDRINATGIGAIDVGIVPGYAYVNRIKNWQFSGLIGLGGVIQAKYYTKDQINRSFLGFAPRIDLKLLVGYTRPKYFILLSSDFDIKSLQIQDLTFMQTFYNIRLTGGFRIKTKDKKSKQKDFDPLG